MTTLTIPWEALASDNKRHTRKWGRAHSWDYVKAREAMSMIAMDAVRGERPRYTGHVTVHLDFYPPNARRRDASNLLKCILDSMSGIVYKDDFQVRSLSYLVHSPDGSRPRVDVRIVAIATEAA